jgi:DNA-binding MarR family transcriptional regulator
MNDDSAGDKRREPGETRSVTLRPRDVSDAVRLLRRLLGDRQKAAVFDELRQQPPRLVQDVHRFSLINRARQELHDRRRREKIFSLPMFREPAWEMLLLLYLEERRFTIASLATASRAKATTALRWIDHLIADELVVRTDHPTDARAVHLAISDKGRQALDLYFSGMLPPA